MRMGGKGNRNIEVAVGVMQISLIVTLRSRLHIVRV